MSVYTSLTPVATRAYSSLKFSTQEDEILYTCMTRSPCLYKKISKSNHLILKPGAWDTISYCVKRTVDECKRRWRSIRDHAKRKKKLYSNLNANALNRTETEKKIKDIDDIDVIILSDDSDVEEVTCGIQSFYSKEIRKENPILRKVDDETSSAANNNKRKQEAIENPQTNNKKIKPLILGNKVVNNLHIKRMQTEQELQVLEISPNDFHNFIEFEEMNGEISKATQEVCKKPQATTSTQTIEAHKMPNDLFFNLKKNTNDYPSDVVVDESNHINNIGNDAVLDTVNDDKTSNIHYSIGNNNNTNDSVSKYVYGSTDVLEAYDVNPYHCMLSFTSNNPNLNKMSIFLSDDIIDTNNLLH